MAKPKGYWDDLNNVERELKSVITDGKFPNLKKLGENGYSSLVAAVYAHGINEVRSRLGFPSKRKSNKFWQEWKNAKAELEKIIGSLGHFPSASELATLRQESLRTAIGKYHGGLTVTAKRMGYSIVTREEGYFQKWENYEKEMKNLIDRLGHFPSQDEMKKERLSGLRHNAKYHGGISQIEKKMGYSLRRKPLHYWEKFENVKNEILALTDKLGHFPNNHEIVDHNPSLQNAILNNGGLYKVRKDLGYGELDTKPKKYWEVWENLQKEMQQVIEQIGHFPFQRELTQLGRTDLQNAVNRHHRGLFEVREKMGYALHKRKINYWKDFENIRKELEEITKELGYFPSFTEVKKKNLALMNAICKYGGFPLVREKLGYSSNAQDLTGILDEYSGVEDG